MPILHETKHLTCFKLDPLHKLQSVTNLSSLGYVNNASDRVAVTNVCLNKFSTVRIIDPIQQIDIMK